MKNPQIWDRLKKLEAQSGIRILPNGKKFINTDPLKLYIEMQRVRYNFKGRDPMLADSSEENKELIKTFALWDPDFGQGALIRYVYAEARKILASA